MLMRRRDFLATGAWSVAALHRPGWAAAPGAAASGRSQRLTAIQTMIDTPEWAADPGKRFDPKKFVRLCREAHAEVIDLKIKNGVGNALFPFRGRPCPRDWVTETRALLREAGIEFVAYYNVGLDNWMAQQHPEWCCVDPSGKPKIGFVAVRSRILLRTSISKSSIMGTGQKLRPRQPEGGRIRSTCLNVYICYNQFGPWLTSTK
jgi:hypothetical protein